jgi:hypothetical protein
MAEPGKGCGFLVHISRQECLTTKNSSELALSECSGMTDQQLRAALAVVKIIIAVLVGTLLGSLMWQLL